MRKGYCLIVVLLAVILFSCGPPRSIRQRHFPYEEWCIENTFMSESGVEIEARLTITFDKGATVTGYALSDNALRLIFTDSSSIDVSLMQSKPGIGKEF